MRSLALLRLPLLAAAALLALFSPASTPAAPPVDDASAVPAVPARADLAFDVDRGVYLAVYSRPLGEASGVFARRLDADGVALGAELAVAQPPAGAAGYVASRPRVAWVRRSGRFVVAYELAEGDAAPRVVCVSVGAADGTVSEALAFSVGAAPQHAPAVAGEHLGAGDTALVFWEEERGIRMHRVTARADGALLPLGRTVTRESSSERFTKHAPAVSRGAGPGGRFLLTWERRSRATGRGRIEAVAIARDGGKLGEDLALSAAEAAATAPSVDGDGHGWVVAWEQREAGVADRRDVLCRALAVRGDEVVPLAEPHPVATRPGVDESSPAVAWTGGPALVAFARSEEGRTEALARTVAPTDGGGCEPQELRLPRAPGAFPAVASEWAGEDRPADARLLLAASAGSAPPQAHHEATRAPIDLGGACGAGGRQKVPCAAGRPSELTARVEGALTHATTFFVASLATDAQPCGGGAWFPALAGPAVVVPVTTGAYGEAEVRLPLPPGLGAARVVTQWATLDPAGPCAFFGGVSFSNALALEAP